MRSAARGGRVTGSLVLLHLITGLTLPYILLHPLTAPDAYLRVAPAAGALRLWIMLLLIGGAASVAIAIAIWPFVRNRSVTLALWVVALAVANLALQGAENANWLAMLSLATQYQQTPAPDPALFAGLGTVVRSAWKWAHYTHLIVLVPSMLVCFAALYQSRLIPRALGMLGIATCLLQMGGISLPVLLGYRMPYPNLFGMPLGVLYLTLGVWLLVKGFPETAPSA